MSSAFQTVREWHNVDRTLFEAEILPLGQPAVLRGLVADWPAVRSGDAAAYLRRFDLNRPCQAIFGAPSIRGRFFYSDDMRGFNFERREPMLGALLEQLLATCAEVDPPAIAIQALGIPETLPGFAAENHLNLLDAVAPRMWMGNRVTTACHYDMLRNIACVVAGRRRFTVFAPDQVANLYMGPFEFTPAGAPVSMVDFAAPDFDRFPRFAQALEAAQVAELGPGDAFDLPYMWWHQVESLERFNLLVNYWWNPAEAVPPPVAAMVLGLLAIRDLPAEQRDAWRAMFDNFVFRRHGDPVAHLPPHAQGALGPIDETRGRAIREGLAMGLMSHAIDPPGNPR
jgi:hypothetical protein